MPRVRLLALAFVALMRLAAPAAAQDAGVAGTVRDQVGDALPGVLVELTPEALPARRVQTDAQGGYRFDGLASGRAVVSFALINFGGVRREIRVPGSGAVRVDATLQLPLNADVTATTPAPRSAPSVWPTT